MIDSLPGIPDGTYLQLLYSDDRYGELLAFYEAWVDEQTDEWSPTAADTSEGSGWLSLALEGEPGYGRSVIIAATGPDNRTSVTLVAPLSEDGLN